MTGILLGDKDFYKTLFRLSLPIMLQNFIASTLNMVDTVMVGQLGEVEIAAVGLANKFYFLLSLFLFGVSSGAAVFTAQFWGAGDIRNIKRVLGLGLLLAVAMASLFTLTAVLFPEIILAVFSKDYRVIQVGAQYLRIAALCYVMMAVTFLYSSVLRSTGHVGVPMAISAVAITINTVLNYIMIFGKYGFPALGVKGAAIATVIARATEVLLITRTVYVRKYPVAARMGELLDISFIFVKKFISTALPIILNETLWGLGTLLYSVAYARMGTGVVAATNIASTVESVALVICFSVGNACGVMVGNRIGAGDEKGAFEDSVRLIILNTSLGMISGTVLALSPKVILSAFNVSRDVYQSTGRILILMGMLLFVRVFNFTMIVGILRSGGDTKFGLIMDIGGVWLISVPLVFISGLLWKLPVHWVYLLVSMEEVFKLFIGLGRFISRKWINNLAAGMQEA